MKLTIHTVIMTVVLSVAARPGLYRRADSVLQNGQDAVALK